MVRKRLRKDVYKRQVTYSAAGYGSMPIARNSFRLFRLIISCSLSSNSYRKMWRWGLIFSAIFFVLNAPFLLLMLQISGSPVASGLNPDALYSAASLCSWLTWAVMFVRGFFAHYLYRQEAARKIRQISQALPQGEGRAEALRRSGGVSWKGVILFALLVVLLDGLVAALLGPNLTALYALVGF